MKFLSEKLPRAALGAIAGLAAFCVAPHADELAAFAGQSVALGQYRGTVYYTPSDAGFNVIVTMDDGATGNVVRLTTTLLNGQAAVLSIPGALGEEDSTVSLMREGERLLVRSRLRAWAFGG